jgi:DNA-directed RNA polymerase specialized sigma24 family protein
MTPPDSLPMLFQKVPFEELVDALRAGEDLSAWNAVFAQILERVKQAVRRRFPDEHLCDDAVDSACRTFLRRVQQGEFTLQGPDALIGLLVLIAYRKATRMYRAELREPGLLQPADLDRVAGESGIETLPEPSGGEGSRAVLRTAMAEHLAEMLEQMRRSCKNALHAKIFDRWFRKECGVEKITYEQIAANAGASERTVRRASEEFRKDWEPLVAEARRMIREFAEALR